MLLAIDPGNEKSAWVIYDQGELVTFGLEDNDAMRAKFTIENEHGGFCDCDEMAIEMIASYGMAVGKTVFETCLWIGRFIERWTLCHGNTTYSKVYRKDVKMHLCNSMRAKDTNIRRAILDLYPPTGGGKTPQVGTEKQPGPLFGVSKDVWAALGVAITYQSTMRMISGGAKCN